MNALLSLSHLIPTTVVRETIDFIPILHFLRIRGQVKIIAQVHINKKR